MTTSGNGAIHRSQYHPGNPPDSLPAILQEFRTDCADKPVVTVAEARKIIMRVDPFRDHGDLAQEVLKYLRNEGVLLDRDADRSGYIFNDPDDPFTAEELAMLRRSARLPAAATSAVTSDPEKCRAYLLSFRRSPDALVRMTPKQVQDRLRDRFRIPEAQLPDFVNRLIDERVLDDCPAARGFLRVLESRSEIQQFAETPVAFAPVPSAAAATPVVAAIASAAPPGSSAETPVVAAAGSPKRMMRVTSAEARIIEELRHMDEVRSLYSFIKERLGGLGKNAQRAHHALVHTGRFLISMGRARHRVDHAVLNEIEFVVDDTLARAKSLGAVTPARGKEKRASKPAKPVAAAKKGVVTSKPPAKARSELGKSAERMLLEAKDEEEAIRHKLAEKIKWKDELAAELAGAEDEIRELEAAIGPLAEKRAKIERIATEIAELEKVS